MKRAFWPCLAAGLVGWLVLPTAAQEQLASAPANRAAATVNGQAIPEVAVLRALRRVPPAKHAEARVEILNFLIDNALIDQYLVQARVPAEPQEVQERLNQIKKEIQGENQSFEKILQELQLTESELRTQIAADIRWDKFAAQRATDAALRELFDKNRDMFDGTLVHARHILMKAAANDPQANEQAKAQLLLVRKQIEDQVTQGLAKLPPNTDNLTRETERIKLIDAAFSALARDKSTCPSKEQGGDVGMFPRAGTMVEPFAQAAFSLKPFQVSDVVTTQFGHHLILVVERRPGKAVKYEDVQEEVKQVFYERLRDALTKHLRAKSKDAIVIHPVPAQP
ncbi:MAG: peptidylprolyl isomerase [Gemmataceae bacterium]